ncbi:hypothetical protein NQD34_015803, partial [Periophthalmus magnuspinnatus]
PSLSPLSGWLEEMGEQQETPYSKNKTFGGPSERSAYLWAMHFTLICFTTMGFGNMSSNTNAKKAFSIYLMIGALMHTLILVNMVTIVYHMHTHHTLQHSEGLSFIREHKVPEELKTRMI